MLQCLALCGVSIVTFVGLALFQTTWFSFVADAAAWTVHSWLYTHALACVCVQVQITSDSVGSVITVNLNKIANRHGGSGEPLLVKGVDLIIIHGCHCGTLITCVTLVFALLISLSRFLFLFVLFDCAIRIAVQAVECFGATVKFAFVIRTDTSSTWVGTENKSACGIGA